MAYSNEFVRKRLNEEFTRWKVTHREVAVEMFVSVRRVYEALRGDPGWLKEWRVEAIADWVRGIRAAHVRKERMRKEHQ